MPTYYGAEVEELCWFAFGTRRAMYATVLVSELMLEVALGSPDYPIFISNPAVAANAIDRLRHCCEEGVDSENSFFRSNINRMRKEARCRNT